MTSLGTVRLAAAVALLTGLATPTRAQAPAASADSAHNSRIDTASVSRPPPQLQIVRAEPATAAPNTSVTLFLNRPLLHDKGGRVEPILPGWVRVMLGTQEADIRDTTGAQIQIVLPYDMREGHPEVVVFEGSMKSAPFKGLKVADQGTDEQPAWWL